MNSLQLCFVIQIFVVFGLAGLLWPDKLMPIFDILMYPWAATLRAVRTRSLAAIAVALLLFVKLLSTLR